ncbi:MAG: hypothetical protein ABI024_05910, partial [Vicinamibacterales bacterium]
SDRSSRSFVDVEGQAVWLQEYLAQRLSNCSHGQAVAAVLARLDGREPSSVCAPDRPTASDRTPLRLPRPGSAR